LIRDGELKTNEFDSAVVTSSGRFTLHSI